MKKFFQDFLNNNFPPGFITLYFFGLNKYKSVIDLGCGFESVLKIFKNDFKLGVEIFEEYISKSKKKKIHHEYIMDNILSSRVNSLLKNFEAVICFDVLEHLTQEESLNLINSIEENNPKFIAFRTTSEYVQQDEYHDNPYQIHKSYLNSKFFKERGYKVFGVDGPSFLLVKNNRVVTDLPISKIIFSYLLRPIYYFLPDKSLNYIAIKN